MRSALDRTELRSARASVQIVSIFRMGLIDDRSSIRSLLSMRRVSELCSRKAVTFSAEWIASNLLLEGSS